MGDASELDLSAVRTLLRDNDETYDADWRVIREALQNALDSFVRPTAAAPYFEIRPGEDYKVKIELNAETNTITIEDNGWGIPQDKYMSLFHLGASGKRDSNSNPYFKGSQGVGIKAVVFGSTSFRVESHDGTDSWQAEVDDWYDFANMPKPWDVGRGNGPRADQGTKVSYTLEKADDSVEIFISECIEAYISAHNAEFDAASGFYQNPLSGASFNTWKLIDAVKHHLLHNTYAGCLYRTILPNQPAGLPLPEIAMDLEIIAPAAGFNFQGFSTANANDLAESDVPASYPTPEFPGINQPVVMDWKTLVENNIERLNKGFYQTLDKAGCIELLGTFTDNPAFGTRTFVPPIGGVMAQHQVAIDRINGIYLCMGNANALQTMGFERKIVLSANGLIVPDATLQNKVKGELPRLQNCHIILDVDDTLGFGKNKPGRRMGNYYDYIRAIWTNLRKMLNLLVEPDGGGNVVGFTTPQKTMASGLRLKVLQDYFGRSSIPVLEQDVIQAFSVFCNKMSATNDWASFVALSTKTTIDAIMIQSKTGAGGVLQDQDRMLVEFKHRLKGVSKGDDDGDQTFSQYDFAVYWKHEADWTGFLGWANGHRNWADETQAHKTHIRGTFGTWVYQTPLDVGENYPLFARFRVKSTQQWGLGNVNHVYLVPLELIFEDICKHYAVEYLVSENVQPRADANAMTLDAAITAAENQHQQSQADYF